MGYDEAVEFAKESVIRDLVSGKNFRGLGPTAKVLIIGLAQPACENAKLGKGRDFSIPEGAFTRMSEEAQAEFVTNVLGIGEDRVDLMTAIEKLVDKVWWFYINTAKEAA